MGQPLQRDRTTSRGTNAVNSINPVDYVDAARVAGVAMMVLGAGLLILVLASAFKKKPECSCDE